MGFNSGFKGLRITIWLRVSKLFCSSRRASKATSPTHFRDGYSIQSTAGAMKLHTVGQNKLIRLCGVLRTSPPSFVLTNESMAQFSHNVYWIRDPSVQITFQIQLNYFFLSDECTRQWQPSILCKPKVFQKQIGHQAVETKIIQNCNKTNSDLCLINMGIERSHNSEIISL